MLPENKLQYEDHNNFATLPPTITLLPKKENLKESFGIL